MYIYIHTNIYRCISNDMDHHKCNHHQEEKIKDYVVEVEVEVEVYHQEVEVDQEVHVHHEGLEIEI